MYDRHIITDVGSTATDIPTKDTLLPYDLVIWSAPQDAPGFIGAAAAITNYLSAGGLLLLSGQDIAYWDSGGSGFYWAPYFGEYLKARYIEDQAASRVIEGQGEIFAGMTITIAGGTGADNQNYPDVIQATETTHASSAWMYREDGSGGQTVGLCLPYRVVYLAFGFEGISDAATRHEVMEKSIVWLTLPRQHAGATLEVDEGFDHEIAGESSVL